MNLFRQAAAHAAGGLGATVGPHLGSAKSSAKNKTASARGVVGPTAGKVTNAASHGWDSTLAAFAPLAEAARHGSEHGTKLRAKDLSRKSNKSIKGNKSGRGAKNAKDNTSWMAFASTKSQPEPTGHAGLYLLLATGAAVGAVGALAARRRTRTKWSEYEPSSTQSDATAFIGAGATSTKSFGNQAAGKVVGTGAEPDSAGTGGDGTGTVTKAATWTKEHAKSTVGTIRHKIHEATADPDGATGAVTDKAKKAGDKAAEKVNEGASHMADKAEARHNAAPHSGGSTTNTAGAETRTSDRIDDEVDDLIRSAKNGRV